MAELVAPSVTPHDRAYPATEATLGDVARAVRRKWRWVVLPTLVAFVLSLVFVSVVTPSFTGEAKLLLQSGDQMLLRSGNERADVQQQVDEQAVASQVQLVMSRDLAREAIRKLDLVGNSEFDPMAGGVGLVRRLGILLGLTKDPTAGPPEDRVLERYYERLVVYPVGKSRIVSVEFKSRDPDLAARAANTIAETYLSMQQDAQRAVARSASSWLGTNIDELRNQVVAAEAKVEAFRSRTGLLTGSGPSTLSAQQLSELSAQLSQARAARSDADVKAKLIRDLLRDGRAFEIPDVANNELVRRLIEQRVNLRAQIALESRTLLPQHPRIKELNAQLQDLDGQIRGAGERIARTLENDSRIAAGRVEAAEAAIASQKKVVADGSENEVQLRALEREARTQREQLEAYLGRYREAVARNTDTVYPAAEARIVSRAVVPLIPAFPKKTPTVALVTLAAFLLSIGVITASELLGGAPARPAVLVSAVERAMSAPDSVTAPAIVPAAAVPAPIAKAVHQDVPLEPALPTEPDGRYDFGALVSRLRRVELDGRARRVMVTGIGRDDAVGRVGEGLALTLAKEGRTVLVEFDADEGAPSDLVGLTDLMAGEASFTDVIRRESGSRLHRIGIGTLRNEAITESADGLDIVLTALDETYDWVMCSLAGGGDAALLRLVAPRVDAVVIASNLEPANPVLVEAYEAVREAGARDVIVAREHAVAAEDTQAA